MEDALFHREFIGLVRKHFGFLESPSCSPWMSCFYEHVFNRSGRPSVYCGYFNVFLKVNFQWEPWDKWLDVRVSRLPMEFGSPDRAISQVRMLDSAPLSWMAAIANPQWRPPAAREVPWLDEVGALLASLAEGVRPVVGLLFEPARDPDVHFPVLEEAAALTHETFAQRFDINQSEADS